MYCKLKYVVIYFKRKNVRKLFSEISKLSGAKVRQIKPKQQANDQILFGTTYNCRFPNMRNLTNKHLPALNSYKDLKRIFAENSACTVFKENRNLK